MTFIRKSSISEASSGFRQVIDLLGLGYIMVKGPTNDQAQFARPQAKGQILYKNEENIMFLAIYLTFME